MYEGVTDVVSLIGAGAPVYACLEPCEPPFHSPEQGCFSSGLCKPWREDQLRIMTGDNLFRLPGSILDYLTKELATSIGWTNNITFDPKEFFVPEPGLWFDSNTHFNGSFKFTLDSGSNTGNDFVAVIPNEELTRPLRGIAGNGTIVQSSNVTELAVFNQSALFGTPVLGEHSWHFFALRCILSHDF